MSKIIVTGGAGYIGSHTVVELINQGYTPIIVDDFSNSNPSVIDRLTELTGTTIDFYEGDCTNKSFMDPIFREHSPIGVIHFAAFKAVGESVEKPLAYYHNNIDSLLVVLELMLAYQINLLVFSSSCTVYGQPEELPVTESSPLKTAESPYGYTKQVAERIIEDSVEADRQLSGIALRYFNPIGAHPTGLIGELPLGVPNNLVPFVTQTAMGLRESLTVFGNDYDTKDGTCVRDYIHVVDLAKAHVSALDYLKTKENWFEAINIGTGSGSTVLEVIQGFEDISGVKLNYQIGPRRAGDVEQVYASVENAEKLLHWKADLSLKDALKDSWNWQKRLSNQD